MTSLLLTSFAPWRAHQLSNTSDDLLALLQSRGQIPEDTVLLRQLPVHFQLAPTEVISTLVTAKPAVVVCCGMAETRTHLTLERYGRFEGEHLATSLDLTQLAAGTYWTDISEDAGDYVCNYLYFRLLAYIQKSNLPTYGLFVHVPLLTPENQELIAYDLALMLRQLKTMALTCGGRTAA
ncbi:MAG: peptidase C15 [Cyanobacteria bacterium J06638_28]